MNAERWQLTEQIFHRATECPPGERDSYLASACQGDEGLRREVESLIASAELPGDFLEQPQLSAGLDLIRARDSRSLAGSVIGPYLIDERSGRGGMGDVYLARDQRLGRLVALKLLPQSFSQDAEWVARFEREARAASAVAHPNIAHIYDVGEFEGHRYIAMEFVEGQTCASA